MGQIDTDVVEFFDFKYLFIKYLSFEEETMNIHIRL